MTVYDDVLAGKYDNTLRYPARPKKPAVLNKTGSQMTPEEIKTLGQVASEYALALEQHARESDAYNTERCQLEKQFKIDLLAEHGVTNHPKADAAYSMAWDRGHSSGYSEIALEFGELVDLLK